MHVQDVPGILQCAQWAAAARLQVSVRVGPLILLLQLHSQVFPVALCRAGHGIPAQRLLHYTVHESPHGTVHCK